MNERRTSRARGRGGFTLIEVLIAVTIVVLMVGVVGLNVFNELFQSRVDKAKIDISTLKQAVGLYNMREGRYPNESEFHDVLINGSPAHPDPYIDPDTVEGSQIMDPWGNPYIYRREGASFVIMSYGADGQPGGEGDGEDLSSSQKDRR